MTEAQEQIAVIEYCDLKGYAVYHIPNQRRCDPRTGAHLKKQGLRAGFPDLCLPIPKGGYGALYIEMKSQTGKPTKEQREWVQRLRDLGNCAYICKGADSAIALIDRYMGESL